MVTGGRGWTGTTELQHGDSCLTPGARQGGTRWTSMLLAWVAGDLSSGSTAQKSLLTVHGSHFWFAHTGPSSGHRESVRGRRPGFPG